MGGTQKSFRFWVSYWDVAQELSPKQQGEFYRAVVDYMFSGDDPEDRLKGEVKLCFKAIKANLNTSKKRSDVGQKGIAKRWDAMTECDSKPIANGYQIKTQIKREIKNETQIESAGNPSGPTQMPEECRALLEERGIRRVK